jgi:hypothetical protein
MRIFLSHSSRDKPLIREIQRNLPHYVKTWIDEREIPLGESLSNYIKNTIITATDFVVIFIGPEAVRSEWVRLELEWALEHERHIKRLFVLPVLLDKSSWGQLPEEFQDRRYLPCTDLSESGVRDFSKRLADELFALVSTFPIPGNIQSSFALEQEDIIRRRQTVKQIACRITDDQENATDENRLTKELLFLIVSSLETIRQVELLCLYELLHGKFKGKSFSPDMDHANQLKIEVMLRPGKMWMHIVDWSLRPFWELQREYGLGDERKIVRDVFLIKISELKREERSLLFSEINIMKCTFDR